MLRFLFALVFTICSGATLAQTAGYPGKSVRVIVPFSAGGTTDVLGRLVAQRLGTLYGQQFVIDNRLGGGGHIGAETVARAAPDGYTLLVGTIGIHATYGIYSKLPYDPAKDLQPVILMAKSPLVVLVHPTLPVRSVREFIALAKAHPGELNFGSAGFGSSTHMTAELFEMVANVKMTHVPYKGSSQAISDLMGGQIQAMFEVVSPSLPSYISSGRLRGLAVTTSERLPLLKDLPTVAEAGVPGYESSAWYTFAAPSKVPAAIIQKLNTDMNTILTSQEMEPRIAELAATRMGGTPEAASKFFEAERVKWNKVIQTAGIRAD